MNGPVLPPALTGLDASAPELAGALEGYAALVEAVADRDDWEGAHVRVIRPADGRVVEVGAWRDGFALDAPLRVGVAVGDVVTWWAPDDARALAAQLRPAT